MVGGKTPPSHSGIALMAFSTQIVPLERFALRDISKSPREGRNGSGLNCYCATRAMASSPSQGEVGWRFIVLHQLPCGCGLISGWIPACAGMTSGVSCNWTTYRMRSSFPTGEVFRSNACRWRHVKKTPFCPRVELEGSMVSRMNLSHAAKSEHSPSKGRDGLGRSDVPHRALR